MYRQDDEDRRKAIGDQVGPAENAHLQQFLFLIIMLMLLAGGIQGLNLMETPSDPQTVQALVFIGLSIAGCLFSFVITLQQRTQTAAIVAILSLTVPLLLRAWGSGLGVRAPIMYLWAPPILIAYYVLGLRAAQVVTALGCLSAIGLYVAEVRGLIAGANPDNLPAYTLNLVSFWIVVVCGLAGANAIRERKENAIAIARERRDLLEKAFSDIELAENSQRTFMEQITGPVASHAQALHALAHPEDPAGGAAALDPARITKTSDSMMQALDSAVEATEKETRFFLTENTKPEGSPRAA